MKTAYLTILFCVPFLMWGQKSNSDTLISQPVQVSVVYPVGSNGANSTNYNNHFSLNIFYGVNGGLYGAEIGGFANILKHDMYGAQFAGFTNIVQGTVGGVQFGGLYNQASNNLEGAQFGGLANVTTGTVNGAQFAGITNISTQSVEGVQAAGINNVANGEFNGAQIAGISNVTNGDFNGIQLAGITNWNSGNFHGAQVGGIYNQNLGNIHGLQLGLINMSNSVDGAQIGLINVADSSNGITLGLFNYVRTGYHAVELYSTDVMWANIALKSGTNALYTFYTAGFQPNETHKYGAGIGLGTNIELGKHFTTNIEASANHINEFKNQQGQLNLLNRLDWTMQFKVARTVGVFAGPSLNTHVSQLRAEGNGAFISDIAINPFLTEVVDNKTQVQMWVGFKFGARLQF